MALVEYWSKVKAAFAVPVRLFVFIIGHLLILKQHTESIYPPKIHQTAHLLVP